MSAKPSRSHLKKHRIIARPRSLPTYYFLSQSCKGEVVFTTPIRRVMLLFTIASATYQPGSMHQVPVGRYPVAKRISLDRSVQGATHESHHIAEAAYERLAGGVAIVLAKLATVKAKFIDSVASNRSRRIIRDHGASH